MLAQIIAANSVISLMSLMGVFLLSINTKRLNQFLISLVGLAAGVLMGSAFIHLLPEAIELVEEPQDILLYTLFAFIGFFLIEKYIHWRHSHGEGHGKQSFGYLNLLGDGLHNFIDGVIIAGAYMTSLEVGLIATLAVILHELPQEIGDFAVLLHAGFSKTKALMFNLLTALTAVIGGIVGYFLINTSEAYLPYLLAVAAGGFLYISAADLIPEIRDESHKHHANVSLVMFLMGITIMYLSAALE